MQDLGGGLAANMSMLMMRQLEAINKSMDKREQQEMKQEQRERKERKWHKKRHAKKKAKKRAKKAALAGLDDHGGKAAQYSSSSSNSNSSSDDSDSDSDSSLLDQSSNYGRGSWRGRDGERDGGGIVTVDE
jgi:hypothetical protein